MEDRFTKGVAFILEGATEKVFYLELIKHFLQQYPEVELNRNLDGDNGEVSYILQKESTKILIKFNVVGTISQVVNSGEWFVNRCLQPHKGIRWTAFLCYDTDNYTPNISKFYEGDWKELRKKITKGKNEIIDIAARADIEDILLIDVEGIFKYLGLPVEPLPTGGKGKSKMKKIFRKKGVECAYHEGERALPLIQALDLGKIVRDSPLPLKEIERVCFTPFHNTFSK